MNHIKKAVGKVVENRGMLDDMVKAGIPKDASEWMLYLFAVMQVMISKPNTIYEIRYDFDLNGGEIEVPEGCTLKFEGGMLRNGTVKGEYIIIVADNYAKIFDDIVFEKLLGFSSICWFGASLEKKDNEVYINKAVLNSKCLFVPNGLFNVNGIIYLSDREIYGDASSSILRLNNDTDLFWTASYVSIHDLTIEVYGIYEEDHDADAPNGRMCQGSIIQLSSKTYSYFYDNNLTSHKYFKTTKFYNLNFRFQCNGSYTTMKRRNTVFDLWAAEHDTNGNKFSQTHLFWIYVDNISVSGNAGYFCKCYYTRFDKSREESYIGVLRFNNIDINSCRTGWIGCPSVDYIDNGNYKNYVGAGDLYVRNAMIEATFGRENNKTIMYSDYFSALCPGYYDGCSPMDWNIGGKNVTLNYIEPFLMRTDINEYYTITNAPDFNIVQYMQYIGENKETKSKLDSFYAYHVRYSYIRNVPAFDINQEGFIRSSFLVPINSYVIINNDYSFPSDSINIEFNLSLAVYNHSISSHIKLHISANDKYAYTDNYKIMSYVDFFYAEIDEKLYIGFINKVTNLRGFVTLTNNYDYNILNPKINFQIASSDLVSKINNNIKYFTINRINSNYYFVEANNNSTYKLFSYKITNNYTNSIPLTLCVLSGSYAAPLELTIKLNEINNCEIYGYVKGLEDNINFTYTFEDNILDVYFTVHRFNMALIFDFKYIDGYNVRLPSISFEEVTTGDQKPVKYIYPDYSSSSSGTTDQRPKDVKAGFLYKDTTLNKWCISNGDGTWEVVNGVVSESQVSANGSDNTVQD